MLAYSNHKAPVQHQKRRVHTPQSTKMATDRMCITSFSRRLSTAEKCPGEKESYVYIDIYFF